MRQKELQNFFLCTPQKSYYFLNVRKLGLYRRHFLSLKNENVGMQPSIGGIELKETLFSRNKHKRLRGIF